MPTRTTELQTGAAAASFASSGEIGAELSAPLTSQPFDVDAAAKSNRPAVIYFNGEWFLGYLLRSVATGVHVYFYKDGSRALIPTREFTRIRLLKQRDTPAEDLTGADDPVDPTVIEPDASGSADDLAFCVVEPKQQRPSRDPRKRRSGRTNAVGRSYTHVSLVPKHIRGKPMELEKNGMGQCGESSNVRQALRQDLDLSKMMLVRQMQRLLDASGHIKEALQGEDVTAAHMRQATATYCVLTLISSKITMLESGDMKLCDMRNIWHLLGEKQDYEVHCGSDQLLFHESKLLQPIDELLATEGDRDTLIHEPTGLCVTCAASGTLTHTAVLRKMHAKVNGPRPTTKPHHACDVSKKQNFSYGFPKGPIQCGNRSCGACSKIVSNTKGTYICYKCETRMNATVHKRNRKNPTPCSWLCSKITNIAEKHEDNMKKNPVQCGLQHKPFHVGVTKVHQNINYCIMYWPLPYGCISRLAMLAS